MTTNTHTITLGDPLIARVELTNNLVAITGASPTLVLKGSGGYWNGSSWAVSPTNLSMVEYDATNFPGYYTYTMTPTTIDNITGLVSYTYKSKVRVESHVWSVTVDEFAIVNNTLAGISGDITTGFASNNAKLTTISSKIDDIEVSGVPMHGEIIVDSFKNFVKIKRF